MFGNTVQTNSTVHEMSQPFPENILEQKIIGDEVLEHEKPGNQLSDGLNLQDKAFGNLLEYRFDDDSFDLVTTVTDQTSYSEFNDKVCSLEMNNQRSSQNPDRTVSILKDFIDDKLVVDLKRKEDLYTKVQANRQIDESNRKADADYDHHAKPEKKSHITTHNINYPDRNVTHQDDNSTSIDTISLTKIDGLMELDSEFSISVKSRASRDNSTFNENIATFGNSKSFGSKGQFFEGNSHSTKFDCNLSKVSEGNIEVDDDNSKVFDSNNKVFYCHDNSMITKDKTLPIINLLETAIKKGTLKDNDVKLLIYKGFNTDNSSKALTETKEFPRKLAEPSNLGCPSTSGQGFGFNQSLMSSGSCSTQKTGECLTVSAHFFDVNNNNPPFDGDVRKQVQGCTTSMHFVPSTSKDKISTWTLDTNSLSMGPPEPNSISKGSSYTNSLPIGSRDTNSLLMALDTNSLPMGSLDTNSFSIGSSNTKSLPMGSSNTYSLPMVSADTNSFSMWSSDTYSLSVGLKDNNSLPMGSSDTNSLPMGSADTNSLPMGSADTNSFFMWSSDTNSLPIGLSGTNALPMGSSINNSLSMGLKVADSLSVGLSDTNSLAIGLSDTNVLPMGSTNNNSLSMGSTNNNSLSMGLTDTDSPFMGSSYTNFPVVGSLYANSQSSSSLKSTLNKQLKLKREQNRQAHRYVPYQPRSALPNLPIFNGMDV